jgi:hypothetical protein
MFNGHAWMHADIIYMISNGELLLDEPELAGIRLGYPWAGHVFQACLSYVIDSPPVSSYIWTNLVWLLCILGISYYIVGEFGGNHFSRITSTIWLCFGLNFFGYVLVQLCPSWLVQKLWLGGDYRSTPWVLKFYFFEQVMFGLAIFCYLLYLMIAKTIDRSSLHYIALTIVLLCGIGVVYPILFAPAAIIVVVRATAPLFLRSDNGLAIELKRSTGLFLALLISSGLTLIHVEFLTVDRVTESVVFPSLTLESAKYLLIKAQGSIIALSLFLIGFVIIARRCWSGNPIATLVLAAGGIGSLILNLSIEIPYFFNEYKFLFTAVICLTPFVALATDRIPRTKALTVPVFVISVIVLIAPFVHKIYNDFPWRRVYKYSPSTLMYHPSVDATTFDLRLTETEFMSDICDAIREGTATNTLLVIESCELQLPTLTQRRLYAPPEQEEQRPGVNMSSLDLLANVRGYGEQLITERRSIVYELFNSVETEQRKRSLEKILQLNQPIALILDRSRHASLRDWLPRDRSNQLLFENETTQVWVVKPSQALPASHNVK